MIRPDGPRVRKRTVDTAEIENSIVTGLIVSTRVCRELSPILRENLEYLQNDYARTIVTWCLEYFQVYDEAPGANIETIYNDKRAQLAEEDHTLVEKLLHKLSDSFEGQDAFNADFLLDRAIEYCKRRELTIISGNIQVLLEKGNVNQAEQELIGYRKAARSTSQWENPFDEAWQSKVLEEHEDHLFDLGGPLGRMIGGFQRGWLVGFMGPMKRGKTFFLLETAVAAMKKRLNVVFISLEMSAENISKRLYKRMSGLPDEEGDFICPVFDCGKNQTGVCGKAERRNRIQLIEKMGDELPDFTPELRYRPCDVCRTIKDPDYEPTTWYEVVRKKEAMTPASLSRKLKAFRTMHGGGRFRVKAYPKFSANITQIKADLDLLMFVEGFVPDVVIIDYGGILGPEDGRVIGRDRTDESWKAMGRLAAERKVVVVTAHQANRGSIKKEYIEQEDTSEDIRVLAHVDIMVGLNQTREEKRKRVMRLSLVAHRHAEFIEDEGCLILQQLQLGQTNMGSHRLRG